MSDLTVIFLTVNKVPDRWVEYHKSVLLEAIGDSPIITISKKPLNWGINLIQEEEPSVSNIYRQLLRGAKLAKTHYIAVAEDDVLYHKSHFEFRPPLDTFAYDAHRWGILTWGKPFYYYSDRISNAALIAPRDIVILSLEERFRKYHNSPRIGELGKEKGTQIDRRKTMRFYPEVSMVFFSHTNSLDPIEQSRRKGPGVARAFDVPHWRKAEELVRRFR